METTVTHHPFRDITLAYDRGKPQGERELATLAQYVELHDRVWKLKVMRQGYEPRLAEAALRIDGLRDSLHPIERRVEVMELGLGLRAADGPPPFEGKLTMKLNDFYDDSDRFNDGIHGLYGLIKQVTEEHNRFLDEYNAFDGWFEAFNDGPLYEIFQDWETVSVDTVSLDRDHQAFLEAWGPVWQAEDDYFARAAAAFAAYDDLIRVSDALFLRVKRVQAALDGIIDPSGEEG